MNIPGAASGPSQAPANAGREETRIRGSMPDKILLEGIRFHGFHGLTRMEREMGVRYSVDVEMTADLSAAARNDRISDTIDYRKVHHLVVEIGRRESYKLIETLAAHLAEEILSKFPVQAVCVRVRKETPVLDGIVDAVGVETERKRADSPPSPTGAAQASRRARVPGREDNDR